MKHTVHPVVFKSGLQGLLIDVPDANVMVYEFNVRAGEYLVSDEKWEVPHLMEHMLLGANKQFLKARDFQAAIEANGAYTNATTSTYDITYEAECADFEWARVLELLLGAISKPLFLKNEFKAEWGNVREELVGRSNNHYQSLHLALRKKMGFLAKTDAERIKLMEHVTIQDVADHYKKTHSVKNTNFIIAGHLRGKRRKLEKILEQKLQLPSGKQRIELPIELAKSPEAPVALVKRSVPNLYFYIDTYQAKTLKQKERDSLQIISTLLTETLYSRILGTAREQGLVYGMGSGWGQHRQIANWWLGTQVSTENAAKLLRLVKKELSICLNGDLPNADIVAAKGYLRGNYRRKGQTVGGLVGAYSSRYYLEESIEPYKTFDRRIETVTNQEIITAFQSMFVDSQWGMGFLGKDASEHANSLAKIIEPLWKS